MSKQADLSRADWIKSSYSSGDRDCVEVAFTGTVTGVRDSKVARGPELVLPDSAFAQFLDGVKADRLGRRIA